MKKLISAIALALAAAATVHAGIPAYSMDRPGSESGRGLYLAAQGGVNLYQSTDSLNSTGLNVSSKSEVGGFGGLKLGYVFGTALDTIRPAVELDGFYNGFSQTANSDVREDGVSGHVDAKASANSGALLANGLVRFALGSTQPYFGLGVGSWVEQETVTLNDFTLHSGGESFRFKGARSTDNGSGFAWQAVAGVDYYVTSEISVFTEYKFLNYVNLGDGIGDQQHLLGAGVRFHF